MLVRISELAGRWLIKHNADPDDLEVYLYGFQYLFGAVLSFGTLWLLAIVFERVYATFFWLAFFLPLRHTLGGCMQIVNASVISLLLPCGVLIC